MKTICTSSCMPKLAIIQISRDGVLRNYRPSLASWKRFIKVALTDNLQKPYKTFRVLTSAGFKAG